jgi:hypothetical protein
VFKIVQPSVNFLTSVAFVQCSSEREERSVKFGGIETTDTLAISCKDRLLMHREAMILSWAAKERASQAQTLNVVFLGVCN